MSQPISPPIAATTADTDKGQAAKTQTVATNHSSELGDAHHLLRLTQDAFRHMLERSKIRDLTYVPNAREVAAAGYKGGYKSFRRDLTLLKRSNLFDTAYYLSRNPDLSFGILLPVAHYLLHGGREGRNPSPDFDSRYYLDSNPDVARAGYNPLVHFLRHGVSEGRLPCPDTGHQPSPTRGESLAAVKEPPKPRFFDRLNFTVKWRPTPLMPPTAPFNPVCMDIHWVIPDFLPGAGGHMTIFRMIRFLEEFGHRQTIWIMSPNAHKTPAQAHETIVAHFQPIKAAVRFLPDGDLSAISGDAIIATDRWTAFPVSAMAHFRRRFYFVQDHEGEFYPSGADKLLAERTYGFGFDCLCAGEWLYGLMRERYGLWAMKWDLAYDAGAYFPPRAPRQSPPRIAFYSRYATARRAVELGMLALEELAGRGTAFEVDMFGWQMPAMALRFCHRDMGVLSAHELGDLYRAATVGVVFSATNHSLIPREMMACGLPVVELNGENITRVFPSGTLELAEPEPFAIADAIERLLTDRERWTRQSQAGLDHVKGFSWQSSARAVETALRDRIAIPAT